MLFDRLDPWPGLYVVPNSRSGDVWIESDGGRRRARADEVLILVEASHWPTWIAQLGDSGERCQIDFRQWCELKL